MVSVTLRGMAAEAESKDSSRVKTLPALNCLAVQMGQNDYLSNLPIFKYAIYFHRSSYTDPTVLFKERLMTASSL